MQKMLIFSCLVLLLLSVVPMDAVARRERAWGQDALEKRSDVRRRPRGEELLSRLLTYPLSTEHVSGIETNDTSFQQVGVGTLLEEDRIGRAGVDYHDGAFVFVLDGVEQGDFFTHARVMLTSFGESAIDSTIQLIIKGLTVESAPQFSNTNRPSQYTTTTASVDWTIDDSWVGPDLAGPGKSDYYLRYASPNIAPVINEIIAQPGWDEESRSIVIVVENHDPSQEQNHLKLLLSLDRTTLEMAGTTLDTFQNRPFVTAVTDASALISMIFVDETDTFIEYGLGPGEYAANTSSFLGSPAYEPVEITLDNLQPDTRYYYRIWVRSPNAGTPFLPSEEYSFVTQRSKGESFTFATLADTQGVFLFEYDENEEGEALLESAIEQIRAINPDFVMDVGDTAMTHIAGNKPSSNSFKSAEYRYIITRQFIENMALPIYYATGNHEAELGFETNPSNPFARHSFELANWSRDARLKIWPNPTAQTYPHGGGDLENYFAFDWGDALFVVLDSYRYTTLVPLEADDWRLGEEQLDWLDETLRMSDKKWKFLFAHHILGGIEHSVGGYNYGDGGGLQSNTGDQKRINELMERYNAQYYFYGHVHFFAHDTNDWSSMGVPGLVNYVLTSTIGMNVSDNQERLDAYENEILGKGFTIANVTPTQVTFSFIRVPDGEELYTFTLTNTPPFVEALMPQEDAEIIAGPVDLTFRYEDAEYDWAKECMLMLDGVEFGLITHHVASGSEGTFSLTHITPGQHAWSVTCTDGALTGSSETRHLFVIADPNSPEQSWRKHTPAGGVIQDLEER